MEVESELGKGTTFHIYFPLAAASRRRSRSGRNPVSPRGGTETILVVEDERDLREMVTRGCSTTATAFFRRWTARTR